MGNLEIILQTDHINNIKIRGIIMSRNIYILLEIVLGGSSILVFGMIFKFWGLSEIVGVIIGMIVYSLIWRKFLKKYDPDNN